MASTIHDVAKYSGLSLGTVSKYINGKPIKEKNREKIEKAIEVLHYRPNNIAKGLRNAKSFAVAVLVPMLSSNFAATIISAIERWLLPHGYCVMVSECNDSEEMEYKKTEFLLSRMVDGIILLPFSPKGKQLDLIQQNNVPVVVIDQMIINHEADSILLDNEQASFDPTEKLIEYGHTDIALLSGNPSLYTSIGRINGYKKALKAHNIPLRDEYILNGNYSMAGSNRALLNLYKHSKHPTAILCSNYEMTLGTLLTMNMLNLKIPEDVSIVGFDNLLLSQIMTPPLFTMEQPMEEMGVNAAKLLYKRINGDYSDFPCIISHKANCLPSGSIKKIKQQRKD